MIATIAVEIKNRVVAGFESSVFMKILLEVGFLRGVVSLFSV